MRLGLLTVELAMAQQSPAPDRVLIEALKLLIERITNELIGRINA